jgi:hypothetical protein
VSAQPSGMVLLGLSLLSTAFAFAMLNHVAFVYSDDRDVLALLPAAALLFLLVEAVRIRRRFITLGERRS